jgi:aryl-alcohol dehydrogenase-like predicted oxidoreductase
MTEKTGLCGPPPPNPGLYNLPFTIDDFQGMPFRRFGSSGLRVSAIGLGTWKFGYPGTGDGSRSDEKTSLKILDKAMEEGVTFWDTANRYNNSSGNSERIIGKWFAANPGSRRQVELATKLYGTMDGRLPNFCRLSRVNILEATYACLDRLQTDRIEIMQFHWFDETTPLEESLMAVEDLIAQDIIRYLGVCNFNVDQVSRAAEWGETFRRAKIQSVQNQFDLLYGEVDERKGVLDYCARNNLSFIPWSPLRGGLISERYLDRASAKTGDRLVDESRLDQELTEAVMRKLRGLASVAREGGTSVAQLAIAFMLTLPGMGPVIAGCSTPEQMAENAGAGRIKLGPGQIEAVRAALEA